jgi:hypothetical protein
MCAERQEEGRREFLRRMIALGVGGLGASAAVRQVLAMAPAQLVEGIRRVQGSVTVNGAPAQPGSLVFPGDTIVTGSASLAVFVAGKDAFLLRENSRLELLGDADGGGGAAKALSALRLTAGKVLSVFGPGGRRLETVTAVAGTRGTGAYLEADPDVTYLCLCYGKAELEARAFPGERATLDTKHHEAPCYILGAGAKRAFLKAPMMNHADEELVMLEALAGRTPPFGNGGRRASGVY